MIKSRFKNIEAGFFILSNYKKVKLKHNYFEKSSNTRLRRKFPRYYSP